MSDFPQEGTPIPRSPFEQFIETQRQRYNDEKKVPFEGADISYWLPKTETKAPENEPYYEDKIKKTAQRVYDVFGFLPPQLTYLLIESTEDWNKLKNRTEKTKGDGLKGFANKGQVTVYTRPGLYSETNVMADDQIPEGYKHYTSPAKDRYEVNKDEYLDDSLQQLLEHETGHTAVREMGVHQQIPNWYDEGLCTLISPLPKAEKKQRSIEKIQAALAQFSELPSQKILEDLKIANLFGIYFLDWTMRNNTSSIPPGKGESPDNFKHSVPRLQTMVNVLRKIQSGVAFDKAFEEVFGKSPNELLPEFIASLKNPSELPRSN